MNLNDREKGLIEIAVKSMAANHAQWALNLHHKHRRTPADIEDELRHCRMQREYSELLLKLKG